MVDAPLFLHPPLGPLCPLARFTVALPLAIPTPRPRTPLERNIGAFLEHNIQYQCLLYVKKGGCAAGEKPPSDI